ncbi:uncharacterized protein LOC125049523 [Pieris napi]|uniref:uncharacterized protein LOC125049523 n=1 Tax=Pieris napi TaxID=78633 RepID=UPI001FBAE17E|nr:uncharacterized protein LOC125049523 [Pieris napi]
MIGQISAFDVKNGNWSAYVERVEMYFVANRIEDGVKLPTLIAVMGEDSYDLLSTLASPKKPSSLTFKEVVNLMETHLQPKPSILAERYRFRQRRQQENESIADYVADLKKLSRFCDFSTTLEDNIRDQFVYGLKSESTRQRLFAEENLCYKKAVSLAINLEAAERDAGVVDRSLIVEQVNKMQIRECKACGDTNHRWEDCVYKNFVCSLCKTTGHLRRMCTGREKTGARGEGVMNSYGYSGRSRGWRGKRGGRSRGAGRGAGQGAPADTYWLQGAAGCEAGPVAKAAPASEVRQQEEVDYTDEEPIYQMSLAKYKPPTVTKKEAPPRPPPPTPSVSTLPYPAQPQGMPLPYGAPAAPYPVYAPMPAMYNPYATLPYPHHMRAAPPPQQYQPYQYPPYQYPPPPGYPHAPSAGYNPYPQ